MRKKAQESGLGTIIFLMVLVIGFITFVAAYPAWKNIINDFNEQKTEKGYSSGLVLLIDFYPFVAVFFFGLVFLGVLLWSRGA